ncbi:MAG: hypothetical protein R6U64_07360 [Bacteroidales bacterium]
MERAEPPQPTPGPVRIKKSLSLKINQPIADTPDETPQEAIDQQQDRPQENFLMTDFLNHWKKLAESLRDDSASLHQAMTQYEPKLLTGSQVEITLDNTIQEETLQERKAELLSHLRKELNNYSIQLVTKVRKIVVEQKAYLPADKFRLLSEKNPEVLKLQKDLDLDFIY